MKILQTVLAIYSIVAGGSSVTLANDHGWWECIAQHPEASSQFHGIGTKAACEDQALTACFSWAREAGLDASQCEIVEHKPAY